MRKAAVRNFCLVLCLALCLSGSAVASEQRIAMGRYVEAPITLPAKGELSFASLDGAIYCVNASGSVLIMSKDMNHWDPLAAGKHDEQVAPAKGGVNGMAVGKDGAVYLSSGVFMMNEEGNTFIERIRDGKPERVQLDQPISLDNTRVALCALPSGELIGLGFDEAYRFSPDGVTIQKYAVPNGESVAVHENEVAICAPRDEQITVLAIESGQVLRTLPMPRAARYAVIGYDANGALYCVCPDGLYQSNAGSYTMTQIADGRLMTVGRPDVGVQALLFDKENEPVIAYSEGGVTSLIAYRYDENVPTEPGTILSVFTLFDSQTLRDCANRFQQMRPDVMLDIIVALPEGTAITRDDAIRTLNMKVLAGKGPDVIVLDGLPVQSYIDKGVLMDLSAVVQPMIDSGELLPNIAGAFAKDGAVPAVPTRFLLPSLWGEVEGMDSISDMAAWAEANPESVPYFALQPVVLISTFYPSCAPAWFADGGLDEEKIEAYLTALKAIRGQWSYEALAQKVGLDFDAEHADGVDKLREFAWNWNPYHPMLYGRTVEESNGCDNTRDGDQRQLPFLLRGLESASYPNGAIEVMKSADFRPLPGQAEGCYVPMLVMAASKNSANGETALKFIEYALGEESQNTDLEEGFQVNVKALDAAQVRGEVFGFADIGDEGSNIWLKEAQHKKLRAVIEALKTPVIPDLTLFQMIVTESAPFFEGHIDAKQAAQNVCAKANAYLSQ